MSEEEMNLKQDKTKQTGFAISQYHDTTEVYRQLKNLVSQPIRPLRREAIEEYMGYFVKKCKKSKAMIDRAVNYIPGGVQHNLAFNYPFPLVFTRASGAYLYDIDGNKYIDFLQAGGPTVLGSNPPSVRKKVIELLNTTGPSTGLFHEYELKLAEFICDHIPGVDMFRMLGSGTEAVMASIRLARVATGKKNIIKCGGAYHGWSDQVSYGLRIPGTRSLEAKGIPKVCFRYTREVYPNDIKALERTLRLNVLRGGTAAVLLEPVGPESGTRPVDFDYNQRVKALCEKFGALLIFDEVVTAFRIGLSGAQGYFGIKPDLTIFGKVVAGGYPSAGGLGGRKDLISILGAGIGGDSKKKKKKAHVGGTMAANPLSSAAGYYTLLEIEKTNACEKAGKAGDRLTQGLQKIIKKYNLPYVAYNQGSICHLETSGTLLVDINWLKIVKVLNEINTRRHMMEEMGAAYMAEGIVSLAGSRLYTSAAQDNTIIDKVLKSFDRIFSKIEGV